MKKIYSMIFALVLSFAAFGQSVNLMHETFGSGGYWMGAMNTNPNLTSAAIFSDDLARTQGWNASSGYDLASGGYHVILADSDPGEIVSFHIPTTGFSDITFSMGAFSWGGAYSQFDFEYGTDGMTWTSFNKDNLTSGDLYGGGWQYLVFSEDLPEAEALYVKITRLSSQVHLDDLILTAEPTTGNALINDLSLDVGSIDFIYYTNDYEVWLPYGTTETPVITTELFDADAEVVVQNAADINSATEAERTSTIEVTSEDGLTTNTYTIVFNVTAPRTDASLSGISLSYGTLAPAFQSDRLSYLVDLPDTATVAPEITVSLSDQEGATYVISEASDIASDVAADRTATITVTAQDGSTSMDYEILFKVGGESTDLFLMDVETFGDAGIYIGTVLNTYPGFTSNFSWGDQLVNIRNTTNSSGYDLASGGGRIEVQAGWGSGYDTLVLKANTSGYKNITLATGICNNSGFYRGAEFAFEAYYSTDSVTWTSIGNETQGETAFPDVGAWSYVILDDVLPQGEELNLMFANQDDNFEYHLDDISLWGTPLSTNNQLAGIALSEGSLSPDFDPNVTEYIVELPQGSSVTPTVSPTAFSSGAVIDQSDAVDIRSLEVADNTTTIQVTAEDGSVRTYSIVFEVFMSSDATLKELYVEDYPLSPAFSNDIFGYAVKLPAGTTEIPVITAVSEDDYATVNITGPVDVTSSDEADRTAVVEVIAEDEVSSNSFTLIFTTGSLEDISFNFFKEEFNLTGTYEAEDYPGYTSGAVFDGDEHKFVDAGSESYLLASGGAAILFGDWASDPVYTELVMKQKIEGYTNIMLSYGMKHNSGGWGDGGCGLTNNFISIEYTLDSITWVALDMDSLVDGSAYPCGGMPFSFVEMGEEIPVNESGFVTLRFTHTDATMHPFYIDDIVLSGSPISTDASLFNLEVDNGDLDPLFDPAVMDYTVELPIGTSDTPGVTATATEETSVIVINDAVDVSSDAEADRTTTIVVTAPDGISEMTYSVVFNVLPNNDATLSSLEVDNGELDPSFSLTTFDYAVDLPAGTVETPTVTAVPTDGNAQVDISDATDITSDNTSERTSTVVVTAEDGVSQLTYSILFTRSTVGIDAESIQELMLYPNPASDYLLIKNVNAGETIRITSLSGAEIIVEEAQSDLVNMNLSTLNSGCYIVKVTSLSGNEKVAFFIKE